MIPRPWAETRLTPYRAAECCSPCLHTLPMAWLAWSTTLPVGLWPHPQATTAFACVALAVPLPFHPAAPRHPRGKEMEGVLFRCGLWGQFTHPRLTAPRTLPPTRPPDLERIGAYGPCPHARVCGPLAAGVRRGRPAAGQPVRAQLSAPSPTFTAHAMPHTPSSLGPPSPPGSSPAPRTTTSMCTTRAVCVCCKSSTSRRPRSACRWR